MSFSVTTKPVSAADKTDTAYVLADDAGRCRAEVWPAFGFNCLQWQVRRTEGEWGDVLFRDPAWETNPVPTRSGHPILFPFPNRLKGGRFTFEGKEYQLPLNDSSGPNAIHGFTPKAAWRVVGSGADEDSAFVSGRFQLSVDAPAMRPLWPADFVFTVSYRLTIAGLAVECAVENPDATPLPFGIGFHPYFCCPNAPGAPADEMALHAYARTQWELDHAIPTGVRRPIPADVDFQTPRAVGPTVMDTLLTDLPETTSVRDLAWLGHVSAPGRVAVSASHEFRELLLFTPPHRMAVAIEPYTCATNAANMPVAGWRVLPGGGKFAAAVRYRWEPDAGGAGRRVACGAFAN